MNILSKTLSALNSNTDFKTAWKRITHIENGHPYRKSEEIESFKSEKHPDTDDEFIFTIHIRKCNDCGLVFYDNGLESRGYSNRIVKK